MKRPVPMNRRRFLQTSAMAAAALTAACSTTQPRGRFLSASELATLEAICEQIIPGDQDPGAAWSGAVKYICPEGSTLDDWPIS
jgi:anaerobic selenocysteine-containing dehydrogenase